MASKIYLIIGLQQILFKLLVILEPMLKIFLQGNRLKGKFLQLYSSISINLAEQGINGLKGKFIKQLFLLTELQKSLCKKIHIDT